jgi:hypothetical protein
MADNNTHESNIQAASQAAAVCCEDVDSVAEDAKGTSHEEEARELDKALTVAVQQLEDLETAFDAEAPPIVQEAIADKANQVGDQIADIASKLGDIQEQLEERHDNTTAILEEYDDEDENADVEGSND